MPFVTVRAIEGVFSPDQKREMISRVTDAIVQVEGENMRPNTWVVIEEIKSGDWGIAGNGVTTADVHAIQGRSAVKVAG